MGILYKSGSKYYPAVQWVLLVIAVLIVAISVGIAFLYTDRSANIITKAVLYYLFYIALQEEMIFRGFIQNYLFGLSVDKKIVFIIQGTGLVPVRYFAYHNLFVGITFHDIRIR